MNAGVDAMVPLSECLTLDRIGKGHWRSRHGEANQNGRSYGGQLLGQAMHAALLEAPPDRTPTMMQFLFLQGAMPGEAVDFALVPLQEGKRFTSLHVRGTQAARTVLDAQVTCAQALPGPEHAEPAPFPDSERPADFPRLQDLPEAFRERLSLMGGYGRDFNPSVAFRIPDAEVQLSVATNGRHFRYWVKTADALPADPRLHASAFAYLSDWWLNFCVLRPHLHLAGARPMYISSLNHAFWLHRQPRSDEWLHVNATSVHAGQGRGLAVAHFHDQRGRHVASATQDCLATYTA